MAENLLIWDILGFMATGYADGVHRLTEDQR